MNATKHLGLVFLLTLAAGVATAAITRSDATKVAAPQETVGDIPRVVVTASRQQQAAADECEGAIPRVVVVGSRARLALAK